MPRPTLPPLPSPHLFSKSHLFPRKYYPSAADPMARSMPGRQIIASRQLADDFVQALDLAEGEVVLECFPGHGQVTRSLLRGGKPGKPKEEWEDWETQREAQGVGGEVGGEYIAAAVRDGSLGTGQDKDKGKAKEEGVFPWTKAELDLSRPATRGESSATDGEARRYVTPPKVVAVEPSYKLLSRALGPADEMALVNAIPAPKSVNPALRASYVAFESPQIPSINGIPSIAMTDMSAGSTSSPTSASSSFSSTAPSAPIPEAEISDTVLAKTFLLRASGKVPINQSIHDPNLVLCNATAYGWSVLPQILSHPLLSSVSKRPWTYIAPPDPSSSGRSVAAYAKYKAEADETGVPIASAAAHAEAAKPPFTVVAHIPNSVGGEQLVSQWIGSATGDMSENGGRQWIWQWGRARLALVVQKNLYDRLMAKPGEAANCRLSILTSALFHRSPLPPYHHVANVDKLSARAYDTPLGEGAASRKKKPGKPGRPRKDKHAAVEEEAAAAVAEGKRVEVEDEERTIYPYTHRPSLYTPYLHPQPPRTRIRESDFFPIAARSSSHLYLPDAPILTRPHFLGIQLVPRVKSPVTLEQKDAWDYVLRNCFVLQGKELREAVGLLGFAAEGLLGKMEEVQQQGQDEHNVGEAAQTTTTPTRTPTAAADEGGKKKRKPWKGEAVDRRTLVRDLTVEQWARVVDVFDRWAFRPKNLLIDSGTSEEVHREIAVD